MMYTKIINYCPNDICALRSHGSYKATPQMHYVKWKKNLNILSLYAQTKMHGS